MSFSISAANASREPHLRVQDALMDLGLDRFQATEYMSAMKDLATPEGSLVPYDYSMEIPHLRRECETREAAQRAAAEATVAKLDLRFPDLPNTYKSAVAQAR